MNITKPLDFLVCVLKCSQVKDIIFNIHVLFAIIIAVGDKNMLNFIRDKTADPYFWNLVWFIGNHTIELDNCVLKESQ